MPAERETVVHVVTADMWGGAPQVALSLAHDCRGEAEIICGDCPELIERAAAADIPATRLGSLQSAPSLVGDIRAFRELKTHIEASGADIVHCHSTKAGILGRLAANRVDVPSVFTVHGWGFKNTSYRSIWPLLRFIERRMSHRTNEIVCVSEHDREIGQAAGILGPAEGSVIHNGIEAVPTDRMPARKRLARTVPIDPDRPVIGAITRLVPQKDPLRICRLGERLHTAGVDCQTVLIGSGPLLGECRMFAERSKADIHVAGYVENAKAMLPGFDLFVLPSRFEGLPLSVLEAMWAGVPVVATDVGGVSEALPASLVVPQTNETAFYELVCDLLADKSRRQALGERLSSRAREYFSIPRMTREYDAVYEAILGE